ncbi:MAG: diaminopimelate decarboxylase [Armatimonadota bacterium]
MPDSRFRLSADSANDLAEKFGTPLYVLDEAGLRERVARYRHALAALYPRFEVSFASKANSTLSLLKIAHDAGATIDVASRGELEAALRAGVPAGHCHLHGNNKSISELTFALEQGVSHIMIDHLGEIDMLASLSKRETKFVLRAAPGVDPKTNAKISTGQADTKFGFNLANGSAEEALLYAQAKGIEIVGIHCHVGSQLMDGEAQENAGELLGNWLVQMRKKHGFELDYLNVGGGLGVKYLDCDEPETIEQYVSRVMSRLLPILEAAGIEPLIGMEPGRSLIAECGLTLYRVGVVKTVGEKTYVAVDGGLADNPRPVMYGARYQVELLRDSKWEYQTDGPGAMAFTREVGEGAVVTISGRHCETDTLFPNVELARMPKEGDLIQVLTTGAYNSSMASNYNRYQRPATVLKRTNGEFALIQRPETYDEMFAREIIPEGL